MTKTTSRHLLDILAETPDFRNNRGKRHPLSAILGLAVIAMMCGYSQSLPFFRRTPHRRSENHSKNRNWQSNGTGQLPFFT